MSAQPASETPFDSIRRRLNLIDAKQGITTEKAAETRRLTREIRQALHVIQAGQENA